jgi:Protein of unknown function (DUF2924)
MSLDGKLAAELQRLDSADRKDLDAQWRRLLKCPPPRHASPRFLALAIAYKLQAQTARGLPPAAQRELKSIARGDSIAARPPQARIKPGCRLLREWHGTTHDVLATDTGFVWRGKTYRSLSAVACAITGAKWSGHRFFGLIKPSKTSDDDP